MEKFSWIFPGAGLFPWLAGGIALVLYLSTLCPTVWWISSGEFIASGEVLGIPHAPGASPYVLLGRLFSLFFPACPEWGINLISALSAAFAVGAVVKLSAETPSRRVGASQVAAFLASAFFAGSLCLWTQATVGERRTFFLALFAGALLAFQAYLENFRVSRFLTGFFLLGIASAIRPNALVYAVVVFVFIIFTGEKRNNSKLLSGSVIALSIIVFLFGFSSSMYLPLRSPHAPFSFLTFGAANFSSWLKEMAGISFLRHTHPTLPVSLGSQFPRFIIAVISEFGPFGFLLALAGFAFIFKRRNSLTLLCLLLLGTDMATWVPFRPLGQGLQHYVLFSFFILVPLIALGIREVVALLSSRVFRRIVLASLGMGAVLNGWNHWGLADRSSDFSARDYAVASLSLTQGASAIFFNWDNDYFPFLPGYFMDGLGPKHLVYIPDFEKKNKTSWIAGLSAALRSGRVYTAFRDESLVKEIPVVPEGPLYRVSPLSPVKVEKSTGKKPLAEFTDGVQLMEAALGPGGTPESRLFVLNLDWTVKKEKVPAFWAGVYLSGLKGQSHFLEAFQPGEGFYPIEDWKRGKSIRERKVLLLPMDLPPGDYRIKIGLYPESKLKLMPAGTPLPNDTLYSESNPFSQRYEGMAGALGRFQKVVLSGSETLDGFIPPLGGGVEPVVSINSAVLRVEPDRTLFPLGPKRRGILWVIQDEAHSASRDGR